LKSDVQPPRIRQAPAKHPPSTRQAPANYWQGRRGLGGTVTSDGLRGPPPESAGRAFCLARRQVPVVIAPALAARVVRAATAAHFAGQGQRRLVSSWHGNLGGAVAGHLRLEPGTGMGGLAAAGRRCCGVGWRAAAAEAWQRSLEADAGARRRRAEPAHARKARLVQASPNFPCPNCHAPQVPFPRVPFPRAPSPNPPQVPCRQVPSPNSFAASVAATVVQFLLAAAGRCPKMRQWLGPGWAAPTCHEMNAIWRQPGALSDGIGGGVGGLAHCRQGRYQRFGRRLVRAVAMGPRRFLPSQSGRRLRSVGSSHSGISRAKLATRAEHGIEGLEEALTCIALLPRSATWPAWP
jgi:hypothetical protein